MKLILKASIIKMILLILLIQMYACQNTPSNQNTITSIDTIETYQVKPYSNTGIILVDVLDIYDRSKKKIGIKANTYGILVSIDSISTQKYTLVNSSERCELHNYVYIRSSTITGWVYGEYIFEKEEVIRQTSIDVDSILFKLIPCKNFGIGVYDEEEDILSFCADGNQSPLLLFNSLYNKYEYIPVDKHEAYSYNYLTLDNHDAWVDSISSFKHSNDTCQLFILRSFQEGNAKIEIEIYLNDKQSRAKVVGYKEF